MRIGAKAQAGVTLIELVVAIVVVAIAASAILGVLSSTVGHSADAMVVSQGVSIAESYLEEIMLKPFVDPDGMDGEAARIDFDDVDDYGGLTDSGARDQFGNLMTGLGDYTVTVAVGSSAALPAIAPGDVLRIDVRVQFPPDVDYLLSGYKTRL